MTQAYLDINHLTQSFGRFKLGPIHLQLAQHTYLILVGPTGSGKSSLLRAIAGTEGFHPGRIFIQTTDIGRLRPEQRRIGYIAQGNDLFPHLNVRQNIAFGLQYLTISSTEKARRIARFLQLFGLEKLAQQTVFTLSGGEQRKVIMARSLITNPILLLLDEPLSQLDPLGRAEFLQLLKTIHAELQTTTLHVTHDRMEAWSIADTCAVMANGKILQSGTVEELFRKPNNLFTAQFLGATNIFPARFIKLKAVVDWGEIVLPIPAQLTQGFVMIRPEFIQVVKRKTKLAGIIYSQQDHGGFYETVVKIAGQHLLIAHLPIAAANRFALKTRVYLDWPKAAAHAFPGEVNCDSRNS